MLLPGLRLVSLCSTAAPSSEGEGAPTQLQQPSNQGDGLATQADDSTWRLLWDSAVVMAALLASNPVFRGASLIELGCGRFALPSVVAAMLESFPSGSTLQ